MSMDTPTGLLTYPITKVCMISTAVIPLFMAVTSHKYIFLAQFDPFILEYGQYYRLVIFQLCALNESDVILLIMIWYQFRNLERILGSYKYISVLFLALAYTNTILVALYMLVNTLFLGTVWNRLPTGPLPTALALFHFYKQYTPHIYEYELVLAQPWNGKNHNGKFKWVLNDHIFINVMIGLLLLNQGLVGICCGFVSWVVGVFMDKGLLPGADRWRFSFLRNILHVENRLSASAHSTSSNTNSLLTSRSDSQISTAAQSSDAHPDDENTEDEPERPLGVQFLDTFRR